MDGIAVAATDGAERSREIARYEDAARGWRLEAQALREHADKPGLSPPARRALLYQAGCADGQASVWEAGAQDLRLEAHHPPVSHAQQRALHAHAARHGRGAWKQRLSDDWERGAAGPVLMGLRDTHGPAWLEAVLLPDHAFDA